MYAFEGGHSAMLDINLNSARHIGSSLVPCACVLSSSA